MLWASGLCYYGIGQRTDPLDLDRDGVTGLQEDRHLPEGPYSRRGAGRDQIAGLKGDSRADERDERRAEIASRCGSPISAAGTTRGPSGPKVS